MYRIALIILKQHVHITFSSTYKYLHIYTLLLSLLTFINLFNFQRTPKKPSYREPLPEEIKDLSVLTNLINLLQTC